MASVTSEPQDKSSNKATDILTIPERRRETMKIILSVFLLTGMAYGVLVWAEIVPYVF